MANVIYLVSLSFISRKIKSSRWKYTRAKWLPTVIKYKMLSEESCVEHLASGRRLHLRSDWVMRAVSWSMEWSIQFRAEWTIIRSGHSWKKQVTRSGSAVVFILSWSLSVWVLAYMRWITLLIMTSCFRPGNDGAQWLWTKTSETETPKEVFL